MSEKMEHSNTTVSSGESELSHSICVCKPFSYFIRKSGCGLLPANGIWQGAGTPATSQMRCWLLPNGRIFPAAAGFFCAGLPYCAYIFHVARTLAQRGLFGLCRAHTRSWGAKPHTAATRASRRGAGARPAGRVDRVDFLHGGKIGTFGTSERDQPLSVAAVDLDQNPVFP